VFKGQHIVQRFVWYGPDPQEATDRRRKVRWAIVRPDESSMVSL
jgi:hypothetical protein